jgi:hypothetical protein
MFATIFCGAAGPISSKCSDTSHATPVLGGPGCDIAATGSATFSAQSAYPLRGQVAEIRDSCGGLAGKSVIVDVELWGTNLAPSAWLEVGQVAYTHVNPSVSAGQVISSGTSVGTIGDYSANRNGASHGTHQLGCAMGALTRLGLGFTCIRSGAPTTSARRATIRAQAELAPSNRRSSRKTDTAEEEREMRPSAWTRSPHSRVRL